MRQGRKRNGAIESLVIADRRNAALWAGGKAFETLDRARLLHLLAPTRGHEVAMAPLSPVERPRTPTRRA